MKPFELPEQPRPGVSLYCYTCENTFSARRGDYSCDTWRPQNVALKCASCNTKLDLVVEHRTYEIISPRDAERKKAPV